MFKSSLKVKMAPRVREEIDVFTIPHSRMKKLVHIYSDKVIFMISHLLFYVELQ